MSDFLGDCQLRGLLSQTFEVPGKLLVTSKDNSRELNIHIPNPASMISTHIKFTNCEVQVKNTLVVEHMKQITNNQQYQYNHQQHYTTSTMIISSAVLLYVLLILLSCKDTLTDELFTQDVVNNTDSTDGNENGDGDDSDGSNISRIANSNDDSSKMLTKNVNIIQVSINNSNFDSEKDDIDFKFPVLSKIEERNINKNNCNVKSRVYALFAASDIANIAALIFVNSKVNINNNSSSTSNKSTINIFSINVNNGSIASASLSNVSRKANSNGTRNRTPDTFDCFSSFDTSEKSITNENSHDNKNINQVGVSVSKYNSNKHSNTNDDVLSSNISSIE